MWSATWSSILSATSWCVLTQRINTVAFWVPEEGVAEFLSLPFCVDNRSLCFPILQARGSDQRQGGYLSTWLQIVPHGSLPSHGLSSGHTCWSGEARPRIVLVSLPLLIKTPVITHHNTLLASFSLITSLNTLCPSVSLWGLGLQYTRDTLFTSEHGNLSEQNHGVAMAIWKREEENILVHHREGK